MLPAKLRRGVYRRGSPSGSDARGPREPAARLGDEEEDIVIERRVRRGSGPATVAPTQPTLWHHLATILMAPRRGFAALMRDPRRLRLALALIGLKAAVYTGIVLLLHLGGLPIMVPAWLAIPAEHYYLWEVYFIGAVTLGCWILAAGVMQLLSTPVGGHGRFEDLLSASAFAITIPSLATIIPDLTVGTLATLGLLDPQAWAHTSVAPGIWRTVIWSYLAVYLVGLLVLFPLAAAAAQGLRGWRGFWVGLAGAVVYQGVYFIFIR
jgi:hypothetical protein